MKLWVIDGSYLRKAQRSAGPEFRLDFARLRTQLEKSGPIWRGYFVDSTPRSPSAGQARFHHYLESARPRGPQLITRLFPQKFVPVPHAYCEECGSQVDLACPSGKPHRMGIWQQGCVDVAMATLPLIHLKQYDTLLLSSGDGDLLPSIEFLSECAKRIELAVFRRGVATALQARADDMLWLDDVADAIRRPDKASCSNGSTQILRSPSTSTGEEPGKHSNVAPASRRPILLPPTRRSATHEIGIGGANDGY